MRKIILKFTFAFLLFLIALVKPSPIYAEPPYCSTMEIQFTLNGSSSNSFFVMDHGVEQLNIEIRAAPLTSYSLYFARVPSGWGHVEWYCEDYETPYQTTDAQGNATFIVTRSDYEYIFYRYGACNIVRIQLRREDRPGENICMFVKYEVQRPTGEEDDVSGCTIEFEPNPEGEPNIEFDVRVSDLGSDTIPLDIFLQHGTTHDILVDDVYATDGVVNISAGPLFAGQYTIYVRNSMTPWITFCRRTFIVPEVPRPEGWEIEDFGVTLIQPKCCNVITGGEAVCSSAPDRPGVEVHGIQTALGCFPTQPAAIVEWIINFAMMLAGGIGFLLMLFASFQIMTSGGDPEKLQEGKQLLGAAISGILLIVFSLFILRFIGATVLRIPGWQ